MNKTIWIGFCLLVVLTLAALFSQSAFNLTDAKASTTEAMQGKKRFEMRTLTLPDGSVISFRFNPTTGESWRMVWKSDQQTNVWETVADTGRIPSGDYDIQIGDSTDTRNPKAGTYFVTYRIDRLSGKTWWQKQGKWHEVTEPK